MKKMVLTILFFMILVFGFAYFPENNLIESLYQPVVADLENYSKEHSKGSLGDLQKLQEKLERLCGKIKSAPVPEVIAPFSSEILECIDNLKFEIAHKQEGDLSSKFGDAVEKIKGIITQLSWIAKPAQPETEALMAVPPKTKRDEPGFGKEWLIFPPAQSAPGKSKMQSTGFIFYPGGLVDPRAYAISARAIAAEGFLVVIPRMPENLATLAPDKAREIINEFASIKRWVIGGHSLGGAMASRFAFKNPRSVQGLVLWAAYPAESDNLSTSQLGVVSIYGSNDKVAGQKKLNGSKRLLPESTKWFVIQGGNHGQFGWYGPHPGDGKPLISHHEQTEIAVSRTVELLRIVALKPWP
ncbi:MAG: hypothetical protein HQM08_12265 [Candidatus Riflebacteria bacterium]|nr:hypothetical protein [Candidatus Riflebacteria bacterium]